MRSAENSKRRATSSYGQFVAAGAHRSEAEVLPQLISKPWPGIERRCGCPGPKGLTELRNCKAKRFTADACRVWCSRPPYGKPERFCRVSPMVRASLTAITPLLNNGLAGFGYIVGPRVQVSEAPLLRRRGRRERQKRHREARRQCGPQDAGRLFITFFPACATDPRFRAQHHAVVGEGVAAGFKAGAGLCKNIKLFQRFPAIAISIFPK